MAQPQAERLERALAWAEWHGTHRPRGSFRSLPALSVAGCLRSGACVACCTLLSHILALYSCSACFVVVAYFLVYVAHGPSDVRSVLSDARCPLHAALSPVAWCGVVGSRLHVMRCLLRCTLRCVLSFACCVARCPFACCLLHVVHAVRVRSLSLRGMRLVALPAELEWSAPTAALRLSGNRLSGNPP